MRDSIISHKKFWTEDSCQHYRQNIVPSRTCFIMGTRILFFWPRASSENENFSLTESNSFTGVSWTKGLNLKGEVKQAFHGRSAEG